MKTLYLVPIIFFLRCTNVNKDSAQIKEVQSVENVMSNEDVFKHKVIVILSEGLDINSNKLNIQDYIQDGKSFIPIFSSMEKFNESTQGQVKNEKIEIDGFLLLSVLKGNETLKLNPGLKDEFSFDAFTLIKKYSSEIKKKNADISKLK